MTTTDILRLRLFNQRLTGKKFRSPSEAVGWFGGVQAQDYAGARWGVGQRVENATDESIAEAFDRGEILRTHVMRPTWHFVHPSDIRWMLQLTAPRVKAAMASYNRKLELDKEVFAKTNKTIAKALQNGQFLMRQELKQTLEGAGIQTNVQRLAHIVMEAELDAIICSGPRNGNQFTYALLDERALETKPLSNEEALQHLAQKYFQSHGPATIRDFVWWSGLTVGQARQGIEMNKPDLPHEEINGKTYWLFPSPSNLPKLPDTAYLLPNYDEYGIAYTEREAFFDPEYNKLLNARGNATFQHLIVYKGLMIGTWKRTPKKNVLILEEKYFNKPAGSIKQAVREAIKQYAAFLSLPLS